MLMGCGLGLALMVRGTLGSDKKDHAGQESPIRILLSYLQMIALCAQFELNWPLFLESLFSFMVSLQPSTILQFELETFPTVCLETNKIKIGFKKNYIFLDIR